MLVLLAGPGCALVSDDDLVARLDLDGDDVPRPADCDDADPTVGAKQTFYVDQDGDGHGSLGEVERCQLEAGLSTLSDDCDDFNADAFPGGTEVCNGVDDDCDGTVDEGVEPAEWYFDGDGDGYGSPFTTQTACEPSPGFVANDLDCNDADATLNPDTVWYGDDDGDGYGGLVTTSVGCEQPVGYFADAADCDDTRADVSPVGVEICDPENADEDCDGLADDADPGATGQAVWYADYDGDGFGDADDVATACDPPLGYVADRRDCDDTNATVGAECRWVKVSAGYEHTCGLRANGVLECWGYNAAGETEVPAGLYADVSAGFDATCAVHTDGTLACWGSANYGAPSPPSGSDYTAVSLAFSLACATDTSGRLTCWGANATDTTPTTSGATEVSVSAHAACALDEAGDLVSWIGGSDATGPFLQVDAAYTGCATLRMDGEIDTSQDARTGTLPAGPFAVMDVGPLTGCALDAAGAATCWGNDDDGQASPPTDAFGQISMGYYHACGVTTDGFVDCWGRSSAGECTPPSE